MCSGHEASVRDAAQQQGWRQMRNPYLDRFDGPQARAMSPEELAAKHGRDAPGMRNAWAMIGSERRFEAEFIASLRDTKPTIGRRIMRFLFGY